MTEQHSTASGGDVEAVPEPTHQVIGPMAIVSTADGQQLYVYEGGVLPADTPGEVVERLVDTGLVAPIDADIPVEDSLSEQERVKEIIARQPDRMEQSGGDVEVAPAVQPLPIVQPSPAAPKADWVDYAVSQGYERSVAESLTKGELVDRLSAR